jgi:hypothetical protein
MVLVVYYSVADLHHFEADADPVLHLSADPDWESVHDKSCESATAPY